MVHSGDQHGSPAHGSCGAVWGTLRVSRASHIFPCGNCSSGACCSFLHGHRLTSCRSVSSLCCTKETDALCPDEHDAPRRPEMPPGFRVSRGSLKVPLDMQRRRKPGGVRGVDEARIGRVSPSSKFAAHHFNQRHQSGHPCLHSHMHALLCELLSPPYRSSTLPPSSTKAETAHTAFPFGHGQSNHVQPPPPQPCHMHPTTTALHCHCNSQRTSSHPSNKSTKRGQNAPHSQQTPPGWPMTPHHAV
jgi:hypothetical protein